MFPNELAPTLVILAGFALTFLVSRLLSRHFRARRDKREDEARRAAETRQVRRARERRQRPR